MSLFSTTIGRFGDRHPRPNASYHLKAPSFWLLAVGGCRGARRLFVTAPDTIAKGAISANARRFCELARTARAEPHKTVFINDIAHTLAARGETWQSCDVDWKAALAELRAKNGSVAALSFALGEDAYVLATYSSAPTVEVAHPGGFRRASAAERRAFRVTVETLLERDWPAYIDRVLHAKAVDFAARTHAFDGPVAELRCRGFP